MALLLSSFLTIITWLLCCIVAFPTSVFSLHYTFRDPLYVLSLTLNLAKKAGEGRLSRLIDSVLNLRMKYGSFVGMHSAGDIHSVRNITCLLARWMLEQTQRKQAHNMEVPPVFAQSDYLSPKDHCKSLHEIKSVLPRQGCSIWILPES